MASGGAPIKVRIVKGANLAMELVDAEQHGWVPAPYSTKAETDASYKRLLDSALRPEWARRRSRRRRQPQPVRRGLGAGAATPADERLEIEMLEGMVPAQARAVQAEAGRLLLYCPIVRADELDASLAYLARRFDENTTPENFLRAMFELTPGSPAWDEQSRAVPPVRRPAVDGRHDAAPPGRRRRSSPPTAFANEPDSDLTDAATRAAIWAAVADAADATTIPIVDDVGEIDAVVARAASAVTAWSAVSAHERAAVLRAAAALDVVRARRRRSR